MVAPIFPPEEPFLPVRYGRDRLGRSFFTDPETGRRISSDDALRRVTFNFEEGRIRDSFGRFVGVAALRLPGSGRIVTLPNMDVVYSNLLRDPRIYRVAGNEELIERLVVVDRNGRMRTVNISYGLGRNYDPSRSGKRWAAELASSTGVKPGTPEAYRSYKEAMLDRSFIIKTWR